MRVWSCNWVVQLLSHVRFFCDPTEWSLPGSSVHEISQARIWEWVAISFSRGASWPRDWTHVSCISKWILFGWATWETPALFGSAIIKPVIKLGTKFWFGDDMALEQVTPCGACCLFLFSTPGGSDGKKPTRRPKFDPWVGKTPWRRKWQPHSSILAWEFHRQKSLAGCSPWVAKSQTQLSDYHLTLSAPLSAPLPEQWEGWSGQHTEVICKLSGGKFRMKVA